MSIMSPTLRSFSTPPLHPSCVCARREGGEGLGSPGVALEGALVKCLRLVKVAHLVAEELGHVREGPGIMRHLLNRGVEILK